MAKTGAPRKLECDIRRNRVIKFSDLEWKQVKTNASESGLKVSAFIRQQSLKEIK